MALRDVMDHAVSFHREVAEAKPVRSRSFRNTGILLLCVPLLAFSAYSWIARPAFIWGAAIEPLPPERVEANLRFAMYLFAQRIEQYRAEEGGYPPSLDAVGDSVPGVYYMPVSDSVFELRATQPGRAIVFRSNESPDTFLGNSVAIIQGAQ